MKTARHSPSTDDVRSRISALHGQPLSNAVVLKGIGELARSIGQRFKTRQAQNARATKECAQILTPLLPIIAGNKSAIAALQTLKQMRKVRRTPRPATPDFAKIEPQIRPGSIMTFVTPPFNYEWSAGSGGTVAGRNMGSGSASKTDGSFGTSADSGINGGGAWGASGVGIYFRPVRELTLLRFYPFAALNYYWMDDSFGMSAHNDAFIGILVQSWDLRGRQAHVDIDHRLSLWSNGTAGYEPTRTDHGEALNYTDEAYFIASSNRQYVLWRWISSSCDGSEGTEFPFTIGSYAMNWTAARTPFMIVEQT